MDRARAYRETIRAVEHLFEEWPVDLPVRSLLVAVLPEGSHATANLRVFGDDIDTILAELTEGIDVGGTDLPEISEQ